MPVSVYDISMFFKYQNSTHRIQDFLRTVLYDAAPLWLMSIFEFFLTELFVEKSVL